MQAAKPKALADTRRFLEGEPVAKLTGEEFRADGIPLSKKVPAFYRDKGMESVAVPEIGTVALDERFVKSSIAHGIGREKASAFAAVPDVLEKGRIIAHEPSEKGSGMMGYFVAAPIHIKENPYVATVLVRKDRNATRAYVHEVILTEKLQTLFKTGASTTREGAPTGNAGAIRNLLSEIFSVNPDGTDGEPLHAANPRFTPPNDPELERIKNETTTTLEDKRTWKQKLDDLKGYVRNHLAQDLTFGLVDSFADIRAAEKRLNGGKLQSAENSAWKQAKMTQNLASTLEYLINKGEIVFKDGWFDEKARGKGLLKRLAPVLDNPEKARYWETYAAAVRAKRLWNEYNADGTRKEKNFKSMADIRKALDLAKLYPDFEPARASYAEFNKSLLDMAEGSGLINADDRKAWENADYVPFYRVMEAAGDENVSALMPKAKKGLADQKAPTKRLTGGEGKVAILENIYQNLTVMTDAAFKNAAMQKTMDLALQLGAAEKVPLKSVPRSSLNTSGSAHCVILPAHGKYILSVPL